ncbi:MAG: hypothetical protein WAM14_16150 [Candidatus Nitrosopolaris sp.]
MPLNDWNIDQQKKEVVIDTFGNEIVEPQPSFIEGTDKSKKKVISQQSAQGDITDCEECEIKECRIKELEDGVRKTTLANQIAEDSDDKIKQLQKELKERTRDLEDKILKMPNYRMS